MINPIQPVIYFKGNYLYEKGNLKNLVIDYENKFVFGDIRYNDETIIRVTETTDPIDYNNENIWVTMTFNWDSPHIIMIASDQPDNM